MLDISYEEQQSKKNPRRRSRRVPLMDELKERAARMDVDISHLGIKRKEIRDYLDGIDAGEVQPKSSAAKKSRGKSKSKSKPEIKTANDPQEPDPGPMSAGPDETKVSPPPDDPKPPKRGFVKTGEAVAGPVVVDDLSSMPQKDAPNGSKSPKKQEEPGGRKSMRQLVRDADEVSITDLLSSDPPK
jgi:hypothetical protein